ncbi:nucleotidyl cyclase domain-containing protein [Dactylosporangium cerinum]
MAPDPGRTARRRRWAGFALVTAVLVAGPGVTAGGAVTVEQMEQRYAGRLTDRYASVGVALNDTGADVDDIVRAADAAMYRAKTAGKGRSVLSR